MIKILWLAPNFNHYKARFLNHLAKDRDIKLTILSGTGRDNMGDQELTDDWSFRQIKVDVPKKDFGISKVVRKKLNTSLANFDWVLIPAEKKNLLLFLYAMKLRKANKSVRLFSYNHPVLKSKDGKVTLLDKVLTKFYYNNLDRVIFYTEKSYYWAIENKLIKKNKAFWANNTIDNSEIEKHYTFVLPPTNESRLLFIGRLIASKQLGTLLSYFNELKRNNPNIKLDIIGDGPEKSIVETVVKEDQSITWYGALVDEAKIAPIMSKASLVFVPGHSGLSINHAFAYGRPYVTLDGVSHAPELDYIVHGQNGYVLDESFETNIEIIENVLKDSKVLKRFCEKAKDKGNYLTVQNWVQQIKSSLLHE